MYDLFTVLVVSYDCALFGYFIGFLVGNKK